MIEIGVVIVGFLFAIALSEFVLSGTKLQTGLTKVLTVHLVVACLLLSYFWATGRFSRIALLIFWAGAFLSWFGIRSHIESSILLRMLYLLRGGPMTQEQLLHVYESHYGEALRLKELFQGGLLEQTPEGITPTPKGKWILRIVSFLK